MFYLRVKSPFLLGKTCSCQWYSSDGKISSFLMKWSKGNSLGENVTCVNKAARNANLTKLHIVKWQWITSKPCHMLNERLFWHCNVEWVWFTYCSCIRVLSNRHSLTPTMDTLSLPMTAITESVVSVYFVFAEGLPKTNWNLMTSKENEDSDF